MFEHKYLVGFGTSCEYCDDNSAFSKSTICYKSPDFLTMLKPVKQVYNVVESYYDYENTFETVLLTLTNREDAQMIANSLEEKYGNEQTSYYVDENVEYTIIE